MKPISALIDDTGFQKLPDETHVCEKHGGYTAKGTRLRTRDVWSRCPGCMSDGAEGVRRATAQERARQQAAQAATALEAMLGQLAIPPRFQTKTFDSYRAETPQQVKALGIARAYLDNFADNRKKGLGLVLAGRPGTGKSHFVASILRGITPEYTGLYTTCLGMIQAIRNTWRKESEIAETEVLAQFAGVDLLVIDEVGAAYNADGERTALFDVLDRRYREMKPTILLTNQDGPGLKAALGERSYDRLLETSKWVAFEWASYRPAAAKEADHA